MNEKTSNKIAKIMEFDDGVYYRATCGCGSDECGLTLALEYDRDVNDIKLSVYTKLVYCSWFGVDTFDKFYWFKDMWARIKGSLKLLFTGRIQLEECFLFKDEDQIDAFITAVQEGKGKIKNDGERKQAKDNHKMSLQS